MATTTLDLLKSHVAKMASEPRFIHHQWFVDHHLSIVEKISLELCDVYPTANRDVVLCLVWLHDLGKIITNKQGPREQEAQITVNYAADLLVKLGFEKDIISLVLNYIPLLDAQKLDGAEMPIEVKIVSSSDGCSHFVGPFFTLYWYENHHLSIHELLASNQHKLNKDWNKKIVLPEARQAFAQHYQYACEHLLPNRPTSYL